MEGRKTLKVLNRGKVLGLEFYGEELEQIKEAVGKYFTVEDVFLEAGVLTFTVSETEIKERFKNLHRELYPMRFVPTAKLENGKVKIRVFRYREVTPSIMKIKILPIILLAATIGTIGADGFLRVTSPVYKVIYRMIFGRISFIDQLIEGLLFTISLIAIIGIHELGHKISAKIDGIESSPPYFIPGIPFMLPTFGAIIFQKSPVVNRDDMFDIGFSGPIAGFLVSIGVAILSFLRGTWVPIDEFRSVIEQAEKAGGVPLPSPLLFYLIRPLFGHPDKLPLTSPALSFAAWLGLLVTALNLFPVWQLDGGRIFRSILSPRQHRIASYISIAILAFTGYFFFALLLLLLMPRVPDIPPLDQVSPLSRSRKLMFIAVFAMLVLSFVPMLPFF
ncbi:MAG: site-2 protease family protein [Thaumarchaeota archaeon]|nr:site-2 protease family protein [Nitrososphaerota archaeon]